MLVLDQSKIIQKVGMATTTQGKYAINWVEGFRSLQKVLCEEYVKKTYGDHHLRLIRILRAKGFVEEKELTKFSLLPQRNLRSILARLITEGFLSTQDVPIALRSGQTGLSVPLYGLNEMTLFSTMQARVGQALLNTLKKQDCKLKSSVDLAVEFCLLIDF